MFCSLLMIEVSSTLGIFEGSPGRMVFAYDLQALAGRNYFLAGLLMAWSIAHNGLGLRCLEPAVYHLMCGQPLDLDTFDLTCLEEDARSCVEQVTTSSTFLVCSSLYEKSTM